VKNNSDEFFMKRALKEAYRGVGRTSPNPPVGAVIVHNDKIIGKGYHHQAGKPHAEIEAIKSARGRVAGARMYVTLEPCNHYGKTPPCAEAIVKAGITSVVIGITDPNPKVAGGGCEYLYSHGLEVKTGVLKDECEELIEHFSVNVLKNRPFISLKSAVTLDGWIATSSGDSKWITNEKSRNYVHRLRDIHDSVVVGVSTVIADNPQLTCRKRGGRNPVRIIFDSALRTPNDSIIFKCASSKIIVICGDDALKEKETKLLDKGAEVIRVPLSKGKPDIKISIEELNKKFSISSILLEGGSAMARSFLQARLIDKIYVFTAPFILGGGDGIPMVSGPGPRKMDKALKLSKIKTKRFGDDILMIGYPVYDV